MQWTFVPAHRPKPAWPLPAEELPRMHVDNALHVAVADALVYFGCPTTGEVTALDVRSGRRRWRFQTEGPVRFAPMFDAGRLYFGSDDGHVYCVAASTGRLVWKYRAGPSGEKVIGNGRIISLWPVRTSVLVNSGVVYATAGVFPYEGVYVYALRAEDGELIWQNREVSDRVYELEFGGASPHGYLVASRETLYVPSGRAMPVAFDRRTGRFLYYASPAGHRGGVWTLLDLGQLVAGTVFSESQGPVERPEKMAYDAATGKPRPDTFAWLPAVDLVPTRSVLYVVTEQGVWAVDRSKYTGAIEKGTRWIKERRSLQRRLLFLRLRATGLVRPDPKLESEIESVSKRVAELRKREAALMGPALRWQYAAQGLVSLIRAGDLLFAGG
ncbi:MAG TPA: hypothetical protein EYP14_12670, partial [Planctomycetaceae bacterium]|nr:hypothetical protein [Planctomycetaceae bacterium]